jgi:class 3 adenylate cyclase
VNEELPNLSDNHRIIMWDPRGFGLSQTTEPGYTLETSLLDMVAVADALALDSFDAIALMTPAHTAIAFAARYPERVRRLVLWNPSQPGSSPRTTGLAGLPDIISTHFQEYIELAALRLFGWDNAPAAKRYVKGMLAQFTAETWLHTMKSMEAVDATEEAEKVQCPTLVVIDPSAVVAQPDRTEYMRNLVSRFPDGELAMVRRGGGYAELVEGFLARDDPPPATGEPSGTAVIFFADIVDSTALTERLGDGAFRAKARELDGALRRVISEHEGTCIDAKTLGDGVLATFSSASQAIAAALACGKAGEEGGLPLHLGLHAGDVIREENNVFGGAVNVAARISGLSAPGEVLVSDVVRSLARTSAGVSFEDRGERELKGVGEAVRVWAVVEVP